MRLPRQGFLVEWESDKDVATLVWKKKRADQFEAFCRCTVQAVRVVPVGKRKRRKK